MRALIQRTRDHLRQRLREALTLGTVLPGDVEQAALDPGGQVVRVDFPRHRRQADEDPVACA